MKRLVLAAIACAPLAFAQLDSNSISVTATRYMTALPDQAVFAVEVTAAPDVTLTQMLTPLQKVGIGVENLDGIGLDFSAGLRPPDGRFAWTWSFSLPVPLSNMQDTARALAALAQSPDTASRGLRVSFFVAGVSASAARLSSLECPAAQLIADARAQAQKMASAAGSTVGPILGVSQAPVAIPRAAFLSGIPASRISAWFDTTPAACAITVKFRLGT